MAKTVEKGISDIVGALADPIIVFPRGVGGTLPDWLKTSIPLARLMALFQEMLVLLFAEFLTSREVLI